jgi:hypoxanthine phosphoribosyltransferase
VNAATDTTPVGPILFDKEAIDEAVARLAASIARDYAGKPLTVLGVLKGALYFTTDLTRALSAQPGPSELVVDYVCTSSYRDATKPSGGLRLLMDAVTPIAGKDVLIAEDIADNGLTLAYLRALLEGQGAASVRTCVLLDKAARRQVDIALEYVGFAVPDVFVVGYGLDYQERYRNLPYVAELAPHHIS